MPSRSPFFLQSLPNYCRAAKRRDVPETDIPVRGRFTGCATVGTADGRNHEITMGTELFF